jgi:hypothetical protein
MRTKNKNYEAMPEGPEKEAAMNSTLRYRMLTKCKDDEEKAKLEK